MLRSVYPSSNIGWGAAVGRKPKLLFPRVAEKELIPGAVFRGQIMIKRKRDPFALVDFGAGKFGFLRGDSAKKLPKGARVFVRIISILRGNGLTRYELSLAETQDETRWHLTPTSQSWIVPITFVEGAESHQDEEGVDFAVLDVRFSPGGGIIPLEVSRRSRINVQVVPRGFRDLVEKIWMERANPFEAIITGVECGRFYGVSHPEMPAYPIGHIGDGRGRRYEIGERVVVIFKADQLDQKTFFNLGFTAGIPFLPLRFVIYVENVYKEIMSRGIVKMKIIGLSSCDDYELAHPTLDGARLGILDKSSGSFNIGDIVSVTAKIERFFKEALSQRVFFTLATAS